MTKFMEQLCAQIRLNEKELKMISMASKKRSIKLIWEITQEKS
jgi:hypothetical protein